MAEPLPTGPLPDIYNTEPVKMPLGQGSPDPAPPARPAYIKNAKGEIQPISVADLPDAINQGFAEVPHDEAIQTLYGNRQGEVNAVTRNFADTATFGATAAADKALYDATKDLPLVGGHLGHSAEEQLGVKEANFKSGLLGTAAGVIVPTLLGKPPTSAPALIKAASTVFRPMQALGETGAAAKTAIRTGLGITENSSRAAKIIKGAIASGLVGSAEGTVFGAGNRMTEEALGDPHAAAESATAEILLNTGLGGILGFLGGGIGGTSPFDRGGLLSRLFGGEARDKLASKLRDWLASPRETGAVVDEAGNMLHGPTGAVPGVVADLNMKAAGASEAAIRDAQAEANRIKFWEDHDAARDSLSAAATLNKMASALSEPHAELGGKALVDTLSLPEKTAERARDLKAAIEGPITKVFSDLDATAAAEGLPMPRYPDLQAGIQRDVLNDLDNNPNLKAAATELRARLADYASKAEATSLSTALAAGRDKILDSTQVPFSFLANMRSQLDKAADGIAATDPNQLALKRGLIKASAHISDTLEEAVSQMGGYKGTSLQDLNALQKVLSQVLTLDEKYNLANLASRFAEAGSKGKGALTGLDALYAVSGAGLEAMVAGGSGVKSGLLFGGLHHLVNSPHFPAIKASAARAALNATLSPGGKAAINAADKTLGPLLYAAPQVIEAEAPKHYAEGGLVTANAPAPAQAPAAPMAQATPLETVQALSGLARSKNRMDDKITSGASTLVRGGVKKDKTRRGEVQPGLSKSFAKDSAEALASHEKHAKTLRNIVGQPDLMASTIGNLTDDVADHAPKVAQAAQITLGTAAKFLHSKLPGSPPAGPLAPAPMPSPSDVAKYNRYKGAVEDPTHILHQAANGTLTPEAVEAVKTVYPSLFDKMKEVIGQKIEEHGTPPYAVRQNLAMLYGKDLDGSMAPGTIADLQSVMAGNKQKAADSAAQDQAVKPSQTGMSKLKLDKTSLTPYQASSQYSDKN